MCKGKPLTDVLHIPGYSDVSNVSYPVTKNAIKKFQSNAKKRRFAATTQKRNPTQKVEKMLQRKKDGQNVTSQILLLKQH